jgi:hypothetical protein
LKLIILKRKRKKIKSLELGAWILEGGKRKRRPETELA